MNRTRWVVVLTVLAAVLAFAGSAQAGLLNDCHYVAGFRVCGPF